jgi:hypothetical protein
MMRRALELSFGAIFMYLAVEYASGGGTLIQTGGTEAVDTIKAFQGR